MKWTRLAIVGLFWFCLNSLSAAEDPVSEYSRIYDDYRPRQQALRERFKQASPRERDALHAEFQSLREEFAPRFLKLATDHPGSEDGYHALLWTSVNMSQGPELDASLVLLREHYLDHEYLWTFLPEYQHSQSDELEPTMRALIERSPSSIIRGMAMKILAMRAKAEAEATGELNRLEDARGYFEQLSRLDPQIHGRSGSFSEFGKEELAKLDGPFALGAEAPETIGTSADGQPFRLSEERGKVVILCFSGHWCGPCRAMYPVERALVKRLKGRPFQFIEINSDSDIPKMLSESEELGNTWKHLCDKSTEGPIATQWEISSWPAFYALDSHGIIRFKAEGTCGTTAGNSRLDAWADRLLEEMEQ